MRAFVIFSVILVHTLAFFDVQATPGSISNLGLDMLTMNFHFTRETFMLITGVVLFYTYYDRQHAILSFWRKRITLIAIPYVAWTAIYYAFEGTYVPGFSWAPAVLLPKFGASLLSANMFFLYFLMVSMQFYVLFPLALKFMKKVENHLGWVFAVSFVIEVAILYVNQVYIDPAQWKFSSPFINLLIHHRDELIFTYQFWFIAGAIISIKYAQIRDWVWSHTKLVLGAVVLMVLLLWATYFLTHQVFHFVDWIAVDTLQPIMVPYSLVVSIGLWFIGMKWARVRATANMRRTSRIIQFFGGVSFGIFLFQPLALHYTEAIDYHVHWHGFAHYLLIPFTAIGSYVLSAVGAYVVSKIPYLSYIVGEKTNLRRRVDKASATQTV
ncbi:acyltransferase [Alicyclobacillus sp. ALC3]|nr:acyltransferase [Alicyclobacillus sp. ALC3]